MQNRFSLLWMSFFQGGDSDLSSIFLRSFEATNDEVSTSLWSQVSSLLSGSSLLKTSEDLPEQRTSREFQSNIVERSLDFLQKEFTAHMEHVVFGNLFSAKIGGVPGILTLVRAYIGVLFSSGGPQFEVEEALLEGKPVWPQIFYCLRSGHVDAAIEICRQVPGESFLDLSALLDSLLKDPLKRFSDNLSKKIHDDYRKSCLSKDPYKRAVYCCLSVSNICEPENQISNKLEDWLWLRLRNINISSNPTDTRNSLNSLQVTISRDFGEAFFRSADSPLLYWKALWLTGQFELAIDYLLQNSACHGSHVALAVYQKGILLATNNAASFKPCESRRTYVNELHRSKMIYEIDFVNILINYTSQFRVSNPCQTVPYYYFLRKYTMSNGDNAFYHILALLVLDTDILEFFFGRVEPDEIATPGLLTKYEHFTEICSFTAEMCEKRREYEKSVKLYDIIRERRKVLQLLNRLLCHYLSKKRFPGSDHDRVRQLSYSVGVRYMKVKKFDADDRREISLFHLLMDLDTFFDLYFSSHFDIAKEALKKLSLIPFNQEDIEKFLRHFCLMQEEVRENLPAVLFALCAILKRQNMDQPATRPEIKDTLKAVISYCGAVPYKFPDSLIKELIELESQTNRI